MARLTMAAEQDAQRQLEAQQEAQRQSVAQRQLEAHQQEARRLLEAVRQQAEAERLKVQHVKGHRQHQRQAQQEVELHLWDAHVRQQQHQRSSPNLVHSFGVFIRTATGTW